MLAYRAAPFCAVIVSYAVLLTAGAPPMVGHRLLLAAYPAIYITVGVLGALAADSRRFSTTQPILLVLLVLLSVVHMLESLAANPDYATYFAPVAGSKAHGSFHLLGDSSDLGQDLPSLSRWLQVHAAPAEPAYLAYCGEDSPRMRAIHARRLPALPNEGCPSAAEPFEFRPPRLEESHDEAVGHLPSAYDTETAAPKAPRNGTAITTAAAITLALPDELEQMARTTAMAAAAFEARRLLSPPVADALALNTDSRLLEVEAEAALLPGVYCIDSNLLHGFSSFLRGPWTDIAEGAYQLLRQEGLHTRRLASPLRFARLCALLRKLRPLGNVGGTIFAWRLTAADIEMATQEAAAEVFASNELSLGMRHHQEMALSQILQTLQVHNKFMRGLAERSEQ